MQQSSNHKHSPWGLAQLVWYWVEGGEVSRFNSQQVQEEKEKDVTYQEKNSSKHEYSFIDVHTNKLHMHGRNWILE